LKRPAPTSPLDSSKAAANEALNNIQARMQDAVVQRDQAIRNNDVVKEKIENQKVSRAICASSVDAVSFGAEPLYDDNEAREGN